MSAHVPYPLCRNVLATFALVAFAARAQTPPADKAKIGAVIHSHRAEIEHCYENRLLETGAIEEGTVTASWQILRNGGVRDVKILDDQSSLANSVVRRCVRQAIQRWRFPKLASSPTRVNYPWHFKLTEGSFVDLVISQSKLDSTCAKLPGNPGNGTVELDWTINADGTVSNVQALNAMGLRDDSRLASCLTKVLRGLVFPKWRFGTRPERYVWKPASASPAHGR